MAPAKIGQILLVLVVCTTTVFGQNDMHSTEAKHRSIGNRPPPFTYYSPHPPTYGVPPPQRVPSYHATYPVSRPTYVAPPSHPVRPSHSPPAYHHNAHQTAQRVPAYQIPYPAAASRPMATYVAPALQRPSYPAPATPRPPATHVQTPRPPVYSSPTHPPHYSSFNYMGHPAHRAPAPPTTTPTPAKVPFTYFASYPSTTPKPYAYSAPSAPVTGPSLLDLPWVKPLYARSPSTPVTDKYSWNVQQARPAPAPAPAVVVVRDDSEEDVGVFISSVNTPVSVPAATPVRSEDFQVRGIPQETSAPVVASAAPTQIPIIIRDESDEDIQIVQEVITRQTPLIPSSPLIIRDESQASRFAPMPTQAPFVPAAIRDDSRQQIQNPAAQRVPSVPLPTTTQVQNVRFTVQDDSVEDIQIAQQVIPSAPRVTQPSVNPIIIRDDSVENIQIVPQVVASPPRATQSLANPIIIRDDSVENIQIAQQIIPSPPRAAQTPVNPIVIRNDSIEDIQIVQRVIPSAPRAPLPSVNPIVIRDDSVENIQIAQQVLPSSLRATQPSPNPIIIRDDSNENIQIVQQVFTSTPSPRTTATPVNSFIIRDDSVEDVQIVQQVPAPSLMTAATPGNPIIIRDDSVEDGQVIQLGQQFQTTAPLGGTLPRANPVIVQDDSVEDFQIVQRIQQVSTITPSPLATQTPRIPVVIRDDSIEDDDRIVRLNLPASNNLIGSPPPSEIPFVRLDTSDELLFRDVPIGVQPVPNVPTTTQAPGTQNLFFRDSEEDFRILQNAPGSPILRTATRDDSLEVRSNLSNEDIELRVISQGVTASNINLSGPLLPTTQAPRRVVLVDSVEDTRRDPGVPISNVQLSGSANVFLLNSNEDVRIAQQVPQPNVPLSGPLPGNSTPPRFVLVDSTEDIQAAQQVSLSNVSPSESSPANAPTVILVESAEQSQAQRVNPLSQSANVVLRQDSLEVPDRSDEVRIPTTVTISQVSTNLAN